MFLLINPTCFRPQHFNLPWFNYKDIFKYIWYESSFQVSYDLFPLLVLWRCAFSLANLCSFNWHLQVMEDKSTDSRNQGLDGHVLVQYYGNHHRWNFLYFCLSMYFMFGISNYPKFGSVLNLLLVLKFRYTFFSQCLGWSR